MPKLSANWRNAILLEAVFDHLSDAIVLYDTNHIITGVNLAAERLFEMSAAALIGRDCHEMFRCQQCEPGCGMHTGLLQANGNNATVRLHTENGLERLVVIRTSQVHNDDGWSRAWSPPSRTSPTKSNPRSAKSSPAPPP
jgi:PAS domain S-box-containing protein